MFLCIVDLHADPADRSAALSQLGAERSAIRSLAGCIDYRVFPSPDDEMALTILHEWHDAASFRRYTESPAFARSGRVVRPLLTESPLSRRFEAALVETVA